MYSAILLALLAAPAPPAPAASPPMPNLDWGACPFECCTYRTWTAIRPTTILSDRHLGAPPAFRLRAGERITATTGVVVTLRPGRIRALSAATIGESVDTTHLRPGDIVYVLHYIGEGNDLLWFKGRKFADEVHTEKPGRIPGFDALELLEPATAEWWVKVKNSSGKEGWTVRAEDFKGTDACGD